MTAAQRADERFMTEALREAQTAGFAGDVPVGAVIVRDGQIVGRGHNRREACGDAVAHAEIEAIRAACQALGSWRLTGCTLYVTLEPCPMCAGAGINARLDRVVYGASDDKAGSVGSVIQLFSLNYNHTPRVTAGVLKQSCAALLSDFFRTRR